MSWRTIYLLITSKRTLDLLPAPPLLLTQAEPRAHTTTCIFRMGSPTVQRTKTTAQTLVAHLLAVVDFRASQQSGTRQTELQGWRRRKEPPPWSRWALGQAGHIYWKLQGGSNGYWSSGMRRRGTDEEEPTEMLMEVSPQLSLGQGQGASAGLA